MNLYWIRKNKENFEKDSDEITKKEKLSSFLDSTIKNSNNLNFLLGSGCSLPSINSMKEMHKSISENDKVKTMLLDFNKDKINNNLENFLNWLNSAIHFLKNDIIKREQYEEVFDICKKIIVSKIKNGMNRDINKISFDETFNTYQDFYNELISIRSLKEKNSSPKNTINIFTTNYDLFNEIALENCGIQYTTGFQGDINRKFSVNNFRFRIVDDQNRYKEKWDPYNAYVKIYKIHGSINWIYKNEEIRQTEFNNNNDDSIIYPTLNKNNETLQMPYSQLFREFSIQLQKSNSTLLVIGYGFSDNHINQLIAQTLSNESFTLIIFGNIDEKNIKEFKDKNSAKNNLHFIGGTDSKGDNFSHFNNFINLLSTKTKKEREEKNA